MHDSPAISGARSWKIVECVESRKPRRDSRGGSGTLSGQTGAKAPGLSGRLKNPGRRFGARDWKWPEKRLCRVSGKPRIAPPAPGNPAAAPEEAFSAAHRGGDCPAWAGEAAPGAGYRQKNEG